MYKKMGIFHVKSVSEWFLIAVVFFVLPLTVANAAIDVNTMLNALRGSAEPIIKLATAIGYVLGFWFVISALLELKKIGQSQSMYSNGVGLGGPLLRIALGVALIYFPSTLDISVSTLWGEGSRILSYQAAASDPFGRAKEGVVMIIRAIGYVSFIRGFAILSNSTKQGAQQGTVGKGIIHIVGGILAINIMATIEVLKNSLGFT